MQRYRNKQKGVFVEAVQLSGDNVDEVSSWSQSQIVEERDAISHTATPALNVKTPVGNKRLSVGMYLVKFDGQFYLCMPGQFEANYDPMTPLGPA